MSTGPDRRRRSPRLVARSAGVAVAAIVGVGVTGCGREFFREWADMDVSEAVFEKSRDPRWRLDMFSVEPPATSRFADPYDVDRLPAPPDDHATEALSPTPQWPHHRLLTPVEGTGYLELLEQWRRERPNPTPRASTMEPPANTPIGANRNTPPPPSETPSPFGSGAIPGPAPAATTPIPPARPATTPAANPAPIPAPAPDPAVAPPAPLGGLSSKKFVPPQEQDPGVLVVRYQAPGAATRRSEGVPVGPQRMQTPPSVDSNTGIRPEDFKPSSEEEKSAVANVEDDVNAFDEAEAAGLPRGYPVYVINPAQAVSLALVNSRAYQSQLEAVYSRSLTVTLARFGLAPQFFAGESPTTPNSGGSLAVNPLTLFTYSTRGTGSQTSGLTLGQVAGFGKVFQFGARLVTGFANSTVFNFVGNNPRQPTVRSYIPLTLVQPFLSGGGRAVTLENLTGAERNLVYQVRNFARFRQQFIPYVIGSNQPINDVSGVNDPTIGYLNVIQQLQDIENDRRTISLLQRILKQFQDSLNGASGISPLQVNSVDQRLQQSVQTLITDTLQYRNALDNYKIQLGLPPDVPLILDRSPLSGLRRVFDQIEAWSQLSDEDRKTSDLSDYIRGLPKLPDVVIDGRPVVESYANASLREEVNLAGERVSLENRLDLMNARGQLYDLWRQLTVQANGLKGVFNVSITNEFLTPPTTSNPFAFVDNSKQFNLVLNTELPLIRVSQRNGYRQAIINYRAQQRVLQSNEDDLKYAIRSEIRNLVQLAETYEIQRKLLEVSILTRDASVRQVNAPPTNVNADNSSSLTSNTLNITQSQGTILGAQGTIIQTWVLYISQRLALYRDLGTIPYDEWEAYYEFFSADADSSRGPDANPRSTPPGAARGGAGAAAPAAAGRP